MSNSNHSEPEECKTNSKKDVTELCEETSRVSKTAECSQSEDRNGHYDGRQRDLYSDSEDRISVDAHMEDLLSDDDDDDDRMSQKEEERRNGRHHERREERNMERSRDCSGDKVVKRKVSDTAKSLKLLEKARERNRKKKQLKRQRLRRQFLEGALSPTRSEINKRQTSVIAKVPSTWDKTQLYPSSLCCCTVRLKPGQDIKSALLEIVRENGLKAAFVLTCVGSVKKATLRFAAQDEKGGEQTKTFHEYFEIVSLVGTISGDRGHLHISLSDKSGRVIGGHVVGDLIVYTTAEIVIGECNNVVYGREMCHKSGWAELTVQPRYLTLPGAR